MMLRWAGLAAAVNAATALAQLITSAYDPDANAAVGLLNNVAGIVWAASYVPIALVFYRVARPQAALVSAAIFAVGLTAMAAAAGLEGARLLGALTFAQEAVAYLPVLGGIGVWLVMSEGVVALETDWPRGPLLFGVGLGFAWFLANVFFGAGGLPTPGSTESGNEASDLGALLLDLGFYLQVFWGMWLARALFRLAGPAAPAAPRGSS